MSLNIVNSFKLAPPPPDIVGGWVELGRTTLGSPGNIIDVTSLADKRYLMVLASHIVNTTSPIPAWRFNSDSAGNYAERIENDGATDATRVGQTRMFTDTLGATGTNWFRVQYLANLATKEKLSQLSMASNRTGVGAGNAPTRIEHVGKWANTSNPIDEYNGFNINTGNFAADTEIVVLGWDPADTHFTNFWEELASADLSGGTADVIDSGTFAAKKYLWVQLYMETTAAGVTSQRLTLNSDTGNNYASRRSKDGGTDETNVNTTSMERFGDDVPASSGILSNIFIVNSLAIEKLANMQTVWQNAAGAGTVPTREIGCWKWANTSEQITKMTFTNNKAGEMGTNTIVKVWGSN